MAGERGWSNLRPTPPSTDAEWHRGGRREIGAARGAPSCPARSPAKSTKIRPIS